MVRQRRPHRRRGTDTCFTLKQTAAMKFCFEAALSFYRQCGKLQAAYSGNTFLV
jgi:hypothetical protein